MRELLEIAERACRAAKDLGADQADVAVYESRHVKADLDKSSIRSAGVITGTGVSVRAYKNGGMGSSFTMRIDSDKEIDRVVQQAVSLAKAADPDPDFVTLPSAEPGKPVADLFDPKLADLGVEEIVNWAVQGVETAKAVDPEAIVSGGASLSVGNSALANTEGVRVEDQRTNVSMYITSLIKRGDDVGYFYDYDLARRLADFDPEPLGTNACTKALSFLGARVTRTATLPVVFGPLASGGIFGSVIGNANAESVQRGRSFMAGKKGEQIGAEIISVVDDPLYPAGISSSSYDGDGVPHKTLTVIDHGVLTTYLHNSYTANKSGEPNTAHSTRGGISPTNLRPEPGDWSVDEIIKDTKEGVYVEMGGLSPNGVTGDSSTTVDFGFMIEDGEISYPIKSTMIGTNILELFRNVDAISREYREEPGNIMPTVRAQGLRVAGAKGE